jgi:hypothetical protein
VHAFTVRVGGIDVEVGNAEKGLCGGMVFAARDFFEHGRPIPALSQPPPSGLLYEYVGSRLKDSFDLPLGPSKYLEYMAAPDGDKGLPFLGWLLRKRVRGIAWRTIHDELPKIIADIDHGHLSCVGLVCASGINPSDLGANHQVLAYRYERSGDDVRLWVYDPNRPRGDDVYLELSTARPERATAIRFVNGSKKVRGFFRVMYASAAPPIDS